MGNFPQAKLLQYILYVCSTVHQSNLSIIIHKTLEIAITVIIWQQKYNIDTYENSLTSHQESTKNVSFYLEAYTMDCIRT